MPERMTGVADELILAVPEVLGAIYLVPASLPAAAARERAVAALSGRVGDHLRPALAALLGSPLVTVDCQPSSALPALPADFQRYLGADPQHVRAVTGAAELVVIRASAPPGWPPLHEWGARAGAAALAADLGVPVVDAFVPKVLAPDAALGALPEAEMRLRVADWVLVFQSAGELGLWSTTKGLGRFGLPELQVRNAPPQLAQPVTRILTGLAALLLDQWMRALQASGKQAAFTPVPAEVEISEADVARAYSARPRGGGSARVRLAVDPAAGSQAESFLTVQPPNEYAASAGEHLAEASAALFGNAEPEIRLVAPGTDMAEAIRTARKGLPGARARMLAGELPLEARLMVKYPVAVPGGAQAGGSEYVWAYVTSWRDPGTVLGYSATDAVRDDRVKAGRPATIDAGTIIDWAVWTAAGGIVEGGWTNRVALGNEQGPHRAG